MNTGMQDAFNLAWKLALVHRGKGHAKELFDSYSIERSAIGDQVLRAAGHVTTIATLRNPIAQFIRNHVASVVTSFGFVQDKIKNALGELSINYRHSPMSKEDWSAWSGGAEAGDRVSDAPLARIAGTNAENANPVAISATKSDSASAATAPAATLFHAMSCDRYNLLLLPGATNVDAITDLLTIARQAQEAFPGVIATHLIFADHSAATACESLQETIAAVEGTLAEGTLAEGTPTGATPIELLSAWIDLEGRIYSKLGAKDRALVLVRPDGYIAYRSQPAHADGLLDYLGRYLVGNACTCSR